MGIPKRKAEGQHTACGTMCAIVPYEEKRIATSSKHKIQRSIFRNRKDDRIRQVLV